MVEYNPMWYNILINYGDKELITKTDLNKEELKDLIHQYNTNKIIQIKGKKIRVIDITRFFISESEEKYESIKDQIRAVRIKERYKQPAMNDIEYFIINSQEVMDNSLKLILTEEEPNNHDDKTKVFIVHGHDEGMLNAVARTLEQLDLKTIILKEKANSGLTIIEKLEKYSDVKYAVILISPDDVAYNKNDPDNEKMRARQNVILELGWFMAKLGRNKVAILHKKHEKFDLPSDILGMLFIEYDKTDGWKINLSKELFEAGIKVNLNRLL